MGSPCKATAVGDPQKQLTSTGKTHPEPYFSVPSTSEKSPSSQMWLDPRWNRGHSPRPVSHGGLAVSLCPGMP